MKLTRMRHVFLSIIYNQALADNDAVLELSFVFF